MGMDRGRHFFNYKKCSKKESIKDRVKTTCGYLLYPIIPGPQPTRNLHLSQKHNNRVLVAWEPQTRGTGYLVFFNDEYRNNKGRTVVASEYLTDPLTPNKLYLVRVVVTGIGCNSKVTGPKSIVVQGNKHTSISNS